MAEMTLQDAITIMDGSTRDEFLYMFDAEDRPYIIARAENMAVSAMKELLEYRELGTLEEIQQLKEVNRTTLFDFLKSTDEDFDTVDTEYNSIITVTSLKGCEEPQDNYDVFCQTLFKKVYVEGVACGCGLPVAWSKLIKDNYDAFVSYAVNYWQTFNDLFEEDVDEFISLWLRELHLLISGQGTDSIYETLVEFVNGLE